MALEFLFNLVGLSLNESMESASLSMDAFSMFIYVGIGAPISEEILFRGLMLRSMQPYGKKFAIFASALVFGLYHANIIQIPFAFAVGLVLGYVTVEYSLVWSIALHMFNNLVLADLLARLTASWPEMALGTLNLVLFGGSALLSVVILFANRKRIRGYQKGEWMDSRCLKCFFLSPGILVMAAAMCVIMISMLFAL